MLSAEIILLILIIITAKYRRQQQCPTHIIGVEPERERVGGREGKVLKGPQNTQILTVMRDSGSFSGQRQQMAFTREKGVKRGKEGIKRGAER